MTAYDNNPGNLSLRDRKGNIIPWVGRDITQPSSERFVRFVYGHYGFRALALNFLGYQDLNREGGPKLTVAAIVEAHCPKSENGARTAEWLARAARRLDVKEGSQISLKDDSDLLLELLRVAADIECGFPDFGYRRIWRDSTVLKGLLLALDYRGLRATAGSLARENEDLLSEPDWPAVDTGA